MQYETLVETVGLSKRFGEKWAIRNLNLSIRRGSALGLLGPNGAGKTTTIRLLNGILRPSEGVARVFGCDVSGHGEQVRQRCGVVAETNLYEKLSARANLEIWGTLYGIDRRELQVRVDAALKRWGLADRHRDAVATFSRGMKQKLAFARALLHGPELLFLDEPTAGLDPDTTDDVLRMLLEFVHEDGGTVVFASHRLEEVALLCETVGIISNGALLAHGSPGELSARLWPGTEYVVEVEGPVSPFAAALLEERPNLGVTMTEHELRVRLNSRSEAPQLINFLVTRGARILRADEQPARLKDVYTEILGRHEK